MTKKEIDQFIDKVTSESNGIVRQKGHPKLPTKKLGYRFSDISHVPQLTIEHGNSIDYYEFEKLYSAKNISQLISKWILFSIQAKMMSGKFYLVVKEKDKVKFIHIINERSLDIELITIV